MNHAERKVILKKRWCAFNVLLIIGGLLLLIVLPGCSAPQVKPVEVTKCLPGQIPITEVHKIYEKSGFASVYRMFQDEYSHYIASILRQTQPKLTLDIDYIGFYHIENDPNVLLVAVKNECLVNRWVVNYETLAEWVFREAV